VSTPISAASVAAAADTSTGSNSSTKKTSDGLGENAFLQLLVTQLQHQDPLQPQDDTAFLAQLAQFSSLEQLTAINGSLTQLVTLAGGTSSSSTSDSATSTNGTGNTNQNSGTTGGN
jgi:flagellar basal-body rod modification protein FlgD